MKYTFVRYVDKIDDIKDSFYSDLSNLEICEKFGLGTKALNVIFKKYYSKEEIKDRSLQSLARRRAVIREYDRRMNDDKFICEALSFFDSELTIDEIATKLNVPDNNIYEIWKRYNKDTKQRRINLRRKTILKSNAERRECYESNRPNEIDNKILEHWNKPMSAEEICKELKLYTPYGNARKKLIFEVFNRFLSKEKLKEHLELMEQLRCVRAASGGKNSMSNGSKAEHYLYELLTKNFSNVTHHEIGAVSFREYDLSIKYNNQLYLIEVSGLHHYKPIYGDEKFKNTIVNDKAKKTAAINKGYNYIVLKYIISFKSKSSKLYLQKKTEQITNLIKSGKHLDIEI